MSHQVAVTQREGEGQSRVCQVAGTPNVRESEGQSRVCQVAVTQREGEGQSRVCQGGRDSKMRERVRASHEPPGGSDSKRT